MNYLFIIIVNVTKCNIVFINKLNATINLDFLFYFIYDLHEFLYYTLLKFSLYFKKQNSKKVKIRFNNNIPPGV